MADHSRVEIRTPTTRALGMCGVHRSGGEGSNASRFGHESSPLSGNELEARLNRCFEFFRETSCGAAWDVVQYLPNGVSSRFVG
jgi:hypothetical protein